MKVVSQHQCAPFFFLPSPRVLAAGLDLVDDLGISRSESDGDDLAAFLVDLFFVSVVALDFATLGISENRMSAILRGLDRLQSGANMANEVREVKIENQAAD